MEISLKETEKTYKKGVEALKTSFFKLKFEPDYLSGVSYFTEAGINYKKLKYFNEAINSFNQAIICNKKLSERWAEGKNQIELAEIYIYELKDNNQGLKCIEQAVIAYKIAGKFSMGIRIYIDFAEKCIINMNGELAMKLLKMSFEDCYEFTHDDLARITFEEGFTKLIDCFCLYGRHGESLDYVQKYLKMQLQMKDEKKKKITKNYLREIMLRLILKEDFLCDDVISQMYGSFDKTCGDDVEDARDLIKSFKELNTKKFNDLMKYSFDFFENNLLKNLRKAYETRVQDDVKVIIPGDKTYEKPKQTLNIDTKQLEKLNIKSDEKVDVKKDENFDEKQDEKKDEKTDGKKDIVDPKLEQNTFADGLL